MVVSSRFRSLPFCLLSGLALAGFALKSSAVTETGKQTATEALLSLPNGPRWRVEALDKGIVRLWLEPSGEFRREPSLATEEAPGVRVPLKIEETADALVVRTEALSLTLNRKASRFRIVASDGVPLVADASITTEGKAGDSWTLAQSVASEERFLGLGEDNQNGGRLDRRGVLRELWAGQRINSGNVTAEYPIPLLLSTGPDGHAYGLFFDNVHRLRFDLAKTNPSEVRCDAEGGEIDLYVIDGPRLADVLERYTRLTGRPSLPPLWALGYWQSKCTYYDWKALDEAYRQLTQRGFPVDALVIDADWPEVVTNYKWSSRWLRSETGETAEEKIAAYAKRGVKIVLSQSGPMIRENASNFASGWAAGVFASDGNGHPVECGYYGGKLLDFTHPGLNAWLWPQTRKLNEAGVAAWWLDLTEPEGEPPQTKYYGGTPRNIHNQYSLLCVRSFEGVQLAVHPDKRPFILTRTGPAGTQRHHAAVWTGDIYSDYATLRAHPPEMLNSGLSGLPWWTCDTGGFLTGYYKDDQFGAHAGLYERWMQFSVFSPLTRAHKAGGLPEPYQYGLSVEQSARHYLKLRYRLLPYIYSYAWESSQNGLPLVRPLLLEYPHDQGSLATPGDQYLFGRELLVAPVLKEGQTRRTVYFPPGRWIDWDYGYAYEGGRSWIVAAPQNRIPVAVKAGAIIPLAPEMQNTAQGKWDPLTLEVFPHGRSTFTLYQDDGESFAYRDGAYTLTRFLCEESNGELRFSVEPSNARFVPSLYRLRFHLPRPPSEVRLDGAALGKSVDAEPAVGLWSWNSETKILQVAVGSQGAAPRVVSVSLEAGKDFVSVAPVLEEVKAEDTETSGTSGRPVPHFFPAPTLPARIKASNYDKGGEGIAFHSLAPTPPSSPYRHDDFGLKETNDVGGGYALEASRAEEWVRYTINCGNGGYFALKLRFASAQGGGRLRLLQDDYEVAVAELPATGGADKFQELLLPRVYLPPGERTLLLLVDKPGFRLNTFEFLPANHYPSVYPATLAKRAGVAELVPVTDGPAGQGAVQNLGRAGSSVTFGLMSAHGGKTTLRLHYRGFAATPLPYRVALNDADNLSLSLPPTGGAWKFFDLPVELKPGANRFSVTGLVEGWDSVVLDSVELLTR